MNMISKERQELEELLPWHATGTLNRRDSDRVEKALATDHELARSYDLVREELAETIHLNETLGAPSARVMEKLFAAIDAEEARSPRLRKSFNLARFNLTEHVSALLSAFTPRTLAWAAGAAAVAILVQGAIIAGVVWRDDGIATGSTGPRLASAPSQGSQGSYAVVRFAPQATAAEISTFLGAYRATLVEGPLKTGTGLYRIKFAESPLPSNEAGKIIRQMQEESRIVGFIAAAD
jgi:hypothetical protein